MSGVLGTTGLDADASGVDQLLHSRIRAGGLPLPGQTTPLPDAFALAGSLLPAVPAQERQPADPQAAGGSGHGASAATSGRAGRGPAGGAGPPGARGSAVAGSGARGERGAASGDGAGSRADGASQGGLLGDGSSGATTSTRSVELAASRDGGRITVGSAARSAGGAERPVPGTDPLRAGVPSLSGDPAVHASVAAAPLAATGTAGAVLIPIAAGLLLTGAAMYKHRGLPRGH
ncbi:hypothetical protein ABH930_004880 [Kitasatospora sp. GAS204A]|uniref:hypothetical protein n=1 Tax=unclassified Kitasatospora TaxID=2633591 RepID=UPI0024730B3D|nr:hypothetical protein [Kitasatospora sp. GAS204B]MDH6120784.1 hypothetical protein [Kitasatospora sp. GAS204B]